MQGVGQTRPGRLGEQAPLAAEPAAPAAAAGTPEQEVQKAIQGGKVVVFSKVICPK